MNKKEHKPITWGQLKKFCNSLDERHLKKQINIIGEERGFVVTNAFKFKEAYHNTSGEGLEPVSLYRDIAKSPKATQDDKDYYEEAKNDISYHKGDPALTIDDLLHL